MSKISHIHTHTDTYTACTMAGPSEVDPFLMWLFLLLYFLSKLCHVHFNEQHPWLSTEVCVSNNSRVLFILSPGVSFIIGVSKLQSEGQILSFACFWIVCYLRTFFFCFYIFKALKKSHNILYNLNFSVHK